MSHPIPGHINEQCDLCEKEAADSVAIETGNNAELRANVKLCIAHMEEQEAGYVSFDNKYADKIERLASEQMISRAEANQ